MSIKSVLFVVALVALLADSVFAVDDVGLFDITNNVGVSVDVHCLVYTEQDDRVLQDLGEYSQPTGSTWTNFVDGATSSIQCAFTLTIPGGSFWQNVPVWVSQNSPTHPLPVAGNDCHWIVDSKGFSILNPANQQYIEMANWVPE